jgi:FkbH-like protein
VLDWLPQADSFGARLREALSARSVDERLRRLAALARCRLDFLETIQLDRALQALALELDERLPRHRLALLGSTTLDHLAPGIRVAGLRRGLWIDVHVGGYGQYRHEIMDPHSAVQRFAPHTVVLSIAAAHALPDIDATVGADGVQRHVRASLGELRSVWQRAHTTLQAHVIQQTFLDLSEPLFGSFDRLVPGSPWSVADSLNRALAEGARAAGVALLDLDRTIHRDGRDAWFDTARMLQAKQEIAPQAAPAYGDLVARVVCAQRGLSKKCLVLDLDNTLWGGVLGDDGVQGLVLGQGSAAGEAHLAVQRYAKQLRDRGVILAVCSKNDPQLAQDAFASHPEMVLKPSDIAAFVANWDDKARNLTDIARQLNMGLDSLVFLDDNPAERARVREALPDVAVPELPDDVAGYVRRLADAGYFEATSFTAEDRQRGEQYAQNVERDALRDSAQSMEEFLQSLHMTVEYGPFTALDLARVNQLINKTNQFNPTTRRFTVEQLDALLATPGALSLQFRLRDRFGDNGLVSAMILAPHTGDPQCLEIDTWVMSCRVFGRQLEHEAMNLAVEAARRAGARELIASYAPTPKNEVIRELYPTLGFRAADLAGQPPGVARWSLQIAEYIPNKTYIARGTQNHDGR